MDFPTSDENYVTDWIASINGMTFASNLCEKSKTTVSLKRKRAKRVRRVDFVDIDYRKTTDGLLIRNLKCPNFRQKFRVPFQLFEILFKICGDNNVFQIKNLVKIPIEIKLLCCLRVLGRDDCA
jgi:hypothetical protein